MVVHGVHCALVRAQRPPVLVLAGDAELARDEGRLLDHVLLVEGRRQAVVGHEVDERPVAEPVAEARLLEDVGRVRHRFHAAGDDDAVVAGADHLVGDLDRADARGADLVDRVRGHLDREPGSDGGLPGRRLAGAALEHLAHRDVLDFAVGNARAVERGADRDRAELRRFVLLEGPSELPEGRSHCRNDDCAGHGRSVPVREWPARAPARRAPSRCAAAPSGASPGGCTTRSAGWDRRAPRT